MEKEYEYYKNEILELFKKYKISSIRVNDVLIDDYSKLGDIREDDKIYINKKYLKLFDKPEVVLKHFVKHDKNLYIDRNGKYKEAQISYHCKYRFLTRFIILQNLYRSSVTKFLHKQMTPIYRKLKIEFQSVAEVKDVNPFFSKFIADNREEIEKIILSILNNSIVLKEESLQYKKRSKIYGKHNLILTNNFLFIYSINSRLLVTTLIHSLNIQNLKSKRIVKDLNTKAEDDRYIFNILKKESDLESSH